MALGGVAFRDESRRGTHAYAGTFGAAAAAGAIRLDERRMRGCSTTRRSKRRVTQSGAATASTSRRRSYSAACRRARASQPRCSWARVGPASTTCSRRSHPRDRGHPAPHAAARAARGRRSGRRGHGQVAPDARRAPRSVSSACRRQGSAPQGRVRAPPARRGDPRARRPRDTLLADVEALTRFEAEYRERMVRALEADLSALRTRPTTAPGTRPSRATSSSRRDARSASEPTARAAAPSPKPRRRTRAAATPEVAPAPRVPRDRGRRAATPKRRSTHEVDVRTSVRAAADHTRDGARRDEPSAPIRRRHRRPRPPARAPRRSRSICSAPTAPTPTLDDDAFFATLRDAVHDEAPLGPRDEGDDITGEQPLLRPRRRPRQLPRRLPPPPLTRDAGPRSGAHARPDRLAVDRCVGGARSALGARRRTRSRAPRPAIHRRDARPRLDDRGGVGAHRRP